MKSIIDVKNLSFRYKESQEYYDVKGIYVYVKRGEWLSIVGHNGSGKSTTVRLIDGLLEAESGEIVIDDQRLTEEKCLEYTSSNRYGFSKSRQSICWSDC